MAEQTVELAPGESKVVSFEAIPHEAKTYQVSVDGLSGSFSAVAPVAVTAEIIEFSKPSAVYSGNPFTTTVRWRNTSDIAYAFDIVAAYGKYLEKMEYSAGAIYDVLAAPGEEKITVVTVPTYKGDIGTFDVIARVGDVKENGYPFLLREYASKYLSNAITLKAVAPPPPPEPKLGERKWIDDVWQEYCGMGIWMPVSIGNLAECQAAGGTYIVNNECRR